MAHVSVTINGKTYRMACDEGQEGHLISLAERFDGYVNQLRGAFGEIGDQRLTVMAGVMVTDEMQEMEKRLRSLETDVAALKAGRDELLSRGQTSETETGRHLAQAAERIEALAKRLSAQRREA
jgi:cell division protein ZapA